MRWPVFGSFVNDEQGTPYHNQWQEIGNTSAQKPVHIIYNI